MSNYQITVEAGVEVNTNIGFAPLSVVVSNFSPYYLYFPDAVDYVAPWTTGAIVQLLHATQARMTWLQTPFGVGQTTSPAPTGLTYSAVMDWVDTDLGVSGGTVIPSPIPTNWSSETVNLTATFPAGGQMNLNLLAGYPAYAYISIGSVYIGGVPGVPNIPLLTLVTLFGMSAPYPTVFQDYVGPNKPVCGVKFPTPYDMPNGVDLVYNIAPVRAVAGDTETVYLTIDYLVIE